MNRHQQKIKELPHLDMEDDISLKNHKHRHRLLNMSFIRTLNIRKTRHTFILSDFLIKYTIEEEHEFLPMECQVRLLIK